MTEKYLDTAKSFIISSPAGSGKTEKLARRYISLIAHGCDVERILAITFTEKASSEMKERILNILASENPEIYQAVKPKVPLMRISTIHAFCLRLLKRFSPELGLDTNMKVMDEPLANSLWHESVVETQKSADVWPLFCALMKQDGLKSWSGVPNHLDELYRQRPVSELVPLRRDDPPSGREEGLLALYRQCLARYRAKKLQGRLIDFSDIELLAYEAISKNPHWQNILFCFDEHTDHILVDEFQDTSALQWRIIDKLTEEWRAGLGAKRDSGTVPTIFLVGDEKQSIYLFRGADVSVVKKARGRLSSFLGPGYEFHEIKDNYRSLPEIIAFTNRLFEKLMPPPGKAGDAESWQISYAPFEARRKGTGSVELLLLDPAPPEEKRLPVKEKRLIEARLLARCIKSLAGRHMIYAQQEGSKTPGTGDKNQKPCEYSDMAVLLRQGTHLAAFEEALRQEGIPFVVLKGSGFYDSPEVALLREFVSFIANPWGDDYSLFCLLRSPLFGLSYKGLSGLRMKNTPLIEALGEAKNPSMKGAARVLETLREMSAHVPPSRLIERLLVLTSGWKHFWEPQRHANIKKFIALVESLEAEGACPIAVRDKLIAERFNDKFSKANLSTEGMNAVKLMTVHAAKGLQFPMVFVPSLDEGVSSKTSAVVIEESPAGFAMRYEPDSGKRKGVGEFERNKMKELEEEKRLFYVAVTRAMDYLFLSGFAPEKENKKTRLAYLEEAFGPLGGKKTLDSPLRVISEQNIQRRYGEAVKAASGIELVEERHFLSDVYAEPLEYEPPVYLRDVTEDILVKTRHGRDWVLIGRLMHQMLEEISGGLDPDKAEKRAELLMTGLALEPERKERFLKTVLSDIEKLKKAGILRDVVLPAPDCFAEFPFVHSRGATLYSGRIDRLIIKDNSAMLYDYKSFPVRSGEMEELVEKYRFQMELYKEAAERLFAPLACRAFLVFTHLPKVIEI